MSKKTQVSQAATNFTENTSEGGASSFMVSKRRQMYQSATQKDQEGVNKNDLFQQDSAKMIPKNMLMLQANHVRSITWPEVFMPDQEIYVTLKGNFYSIKDSRNKQKFINRNSKPNAQIMYFNVQKNRDNIILSSVQKYILSQKDKNQELWYHFHIVILNIESDKMEQFSSVQKGFVEVSSIKTASNLSAKIGQIYCLQFKGLQLIDNYKKAFAVFQPIGRQRTIYQVVMIDFLKTNSLQSSQNLRYSSSSSVSKKVGSVYLQRKQTQNYMKMINSEYGDIVLLITSKQIYELEMAGQFKPGEYSLILKPLVMQKLLQQNKNTYVSNQTNQLVLSKQIFKKQETIIDSQYIMNGLKFMALTSHGRIFVIQSQQCIFSESLYEVLSHKQMIQNYKIENFVFRKIHFLRGLLVVQVEAEKKNDCNLAKQIRYEESILQKLDQKNQVDYVSRGLLIAKVQSSSLSFSKFIPLPFQLKDFQSFKVDPFKQTDQILLQAINIKDTQVLELHRCQILSNKNGFIPFSIQNYLKQTIICIEFNQNQPALSRQPQIKGPLKITFGKSNKSLYTLRGNQVCGYRIYSNQIIGTIKNGVQKTLTCSFFQKPLKIITNPLTGYVVILFREFIKFFLNTYTQLKLFHTINIRNVNDVSFSKYGESILICMNDNSIHLIDSYKFTEQKIMDFYGEVKQSMLVSEYVLYVRNTKNVLNIFRKNSGHQGTVASRSKSEFAQKYDKLYELKIQNDDIYCVDQNYTVLVKKNAEVEFYSHIPEDRKLKNGTDQNQMIRLNILSQQHPHLLNKKKLQMERCQYPTYAFYSSQFSTLFVGTSSGNVRQYLYPFLSIQDPSPPTCYKFHTANNSIIHMEINGNFSAVYVFTELSQVIELNFTQYLNGQKKNAIYTLSKVQASSTQLKYEFANRKYLIDDFTPISEQIKNSISQHYDEVCFIDDKIKDDIDDTTNKIKHECHKQIEVLSKQKTNLDKNFNKQFGQISSKLKTDVIIINKDLVTLRQEHNKIKDQLVEQYDKQLLEIYKENDRLTGIKRDKIKEYKKYIYDMNQDFKKVLDEEIQLRQIQTQKLEAYYEKVNQKYATYRKIALTEVEENKHELGSLRTIEINKVQDQLKQQQLKKQSFLSKMGKTQKQIERFRKRQIYFENLVVQTRNQIEQLQADISLYEEKKSSLNQQLNEKQSIIQDKQKLIVTFLKNTNEMKKVKNIHEFQLREFQGEILPVEKKIKQLEYQVQKMNFQIMDQFNSKVQQNSLIEGSSKRIQKLKYKSSQMKDNLLKSKTKIIRFTQQLSVILTDPFCPQVRQRLASVLDKFSRQNQVFVANQQLQKGKKQGDKLMRRKNILRKTIQQEEKFQEGVLRNKNQFFRYYVDNTNLVKEYNELFKDHNILIQDKKKLQDRLNLIKSNMNRATPLKRTASMHIRKISEKKLTPFQRYEQDQFDFGTLKAKQTTQTRVSRGQQPTTFLKSLIKDIGSAQTNYDKANLIRDRIQTFVNPQIQRKKQVQKQLFQRQRGKSNNIPLLRL